MMYVFCYFFKKHDKLIVSFEFYFIFKLYNIVLVLPNIEMNLKKETDTKKRLSSPPLVWKTWVLSGLPRSMAWSGWRPHTSKRARFRRRLLAQELAAIAAHSGQGGSTSQINAVYKLSQLCCFL